MGEIYDSNKRVLPDRLPWMMKQIWSDILFLHYPVKKEKIEILLPPKIQLDTYEGQAWITIVPYVIKSIGVRGLPFIPLGRGIPGINVRTYVKMGEKPGIYFLKLALPQKLTAMMAKYLFHLPYISMDLSFEKTEKMIQFESKTNPLPFTCQYRVLPASSPIKKETLEEWLLERYCFYTTNTKGKVIRCDIIHEPWFIHKVELVGIENGILSTFHIQSESTHPLIQYSKDANVRLWPIVTAK
ncbi:YqjF family protein [Ureibacillus thermophilus]|uniref:YqjF family protein n=1 Tax=Ureibacillus thermophilus TaxID=367743 RepID=UPI003620EEFC